jgi:hypothetical protein
MATEEMSHREQQFLFLPAASGGGVLVRRAQVVGARPNGQDGAIVYTAAGPSLYTTLTTKQIANYLAAEQVEQR